MQILNKAKDADVIVRFLNRALKDDPEAITALFAHRVSCNERLADHPTIQCGQVTKDAPVTVGVLGLLNGLCGVDGQGWGFIEATWTDDGKLLGFAVRPEQENA